MLVLLVLLAGRGIRSRLLLGQEDQWRQQLWLDELLAPAPGAQAVEKKPPPRLTSPLPINLCGRDSLTLLPGVGPVLADRIDAVRKAGTVFRSPQDLETVKGIGPALSAKLEAVIDFRTASAVPAPTDSLP